MAKFQLTPDQSLAVHRRTSLLVSAAAGSGKTRVLTQRLMAYVTDEAEPCGINEFLVITYTRAAAAELRSRVLDELSKISGENPQNRRLRRQSTLAYKAQIGTIHSFCTSVLRENAHKLGLSPDFSVGDEDRCRQLKDKSLQNCLDAAYARIAEDGNFSALAESVGAGRDDDRLMRCVLELHEKMQSHPYPELWAQLKSAEMNLSEVTDVENTVWGAEVIENARKTAEFWSNTLDSLWFEICENEEENAKLISAYGNSLLTTTEGIRNFLRALEQGWDKAFKALPIEFPKLGPLRDFPFEERQALFKTLRDSAKKELSELSSIFDSDSAKQLADLARTLPAMRGLFSLTLDFDRRYSAEKRRRSMMDFSDLEHFTVRLLCDQETGRPTETARELSQRYREILVDEFQDVNSVQDLIFNCISKNGKNIFCVGDVKQSIYRFRLADPKIFLNLLEKQPLVSDADINAPATVLLRNNFRSDRRILSACNSVFRSIMSRELGDIDYNDDCALYPPDTAPEERGDAKLTIIRLDREDEDSPDKSSLEAGYIAGEIRKLTNGSQTILDDGELRPIRYGDIAILLRSPGSVGRIFKNVLSKFGIPVSAQQGGGFFTAPEVVILTSLLTIVDNPHRDVPLTAVLASSIFAFTPDELTEIRTFDMDKSFYETCLSYAQNCPEDSKIGSFLAILDELRELSLNIGVHSLLLHIYDKLELPALWTAIKGSHEGTVNLGIYADLAANFEAGGFRGLSDFIKRLETMQNRGQDPAATPSESQNAVAIMSIHKSKGLEFPVVFLADTARKFNKSDLKSSVLIHAEFGLGGKITDTLRGIEYPSIAHRAIKSRLDRESLSEEIRVLYVAMTRARERLYITCTSNKPEELLEKLNTAHFNAPEAQLLRGFPSMSHWLITAALSVPNSPLSLEIADFSADENTAETRDESPSSTAVDVPDALRAVLDYRYPFAYAASLPSKITATTLKDSDDETAELVKPKSRIFDNPNFSGIEKPLSGAERGIATHTVMQFIDFSRTESPSEIESEISRIYSLGNLTDRQASAVDRRSILNFFASNIGKRIRNADNILREFRFSLLCPASDFYPDAGDEKILLQGIVDCCIEEDGVLTVVDYKTDYVTPETLQELCEHYKPQLDAYVLALGRITKKPVRGSVLCFLRAGLTMEI